MKSKKMFMIYDCCFNLPDDFNGTCGDALMLLTQARLESEKNNKISKKKDTTIGCYEKVWNTPDIKGDIEYSLAELSEDGTKWVNMSQG